MNKTFGEFLSERRKAQGITQKELAGKLFVSESTVSKWEQNRSNPDISIITKLSEILGVSEHELITASIDTAERERAESAKKWRRLVTGWQLTFLIAYGIALLTCFIVNLAVNKTLSWFWIVFSSLLLAATFTTTPRFIKFYKLLIIPISQLLALLLLLAVCCLYSNGRWFFVALAPVALAFAIVFLPIYVKAYNFPRIIKNHGAVFCVVIDFLLLTATLFIIQAYIKPISPWVIDFALPIELFFFGVALLIILVARYLPLGKLIKTGLILLISAIAYPLMQIVVDALLFNKWGTDKPSTYLPNLTVWAGEYLNNNIGFLTVLTLLLLAAGFIIGGILKGKKR